MFRRTTPWTVVSLLAAVLLALPFFTPDAPFASAHTARHAVAKAQPKIQLSGKALRDQTATAGHCDHSAGEPAGPLRLRERHVNSGLASEAPERHSCARDAARFHDPVALRAVHLSRPPTTRSPAALQVFRC